MSERKNAPAGAGTPTEARQENGLAGVFPCVNSTTDGAARQPHGKIFDLLSAGEENAVPARDLANLTGISPRGLRRAIDHERENGLFILSSDAGYFRPADSGPAGVAEIRRFLRRQDSRMLSNRRTTARLRRLLRAAERGPLDGQMMIGEEDGDG